MKYEARRGDATVEDLNNDGNFTNDYLASTDHTVNPWVNLTASQMQAACRGHGFNETTFKGYDVISNMEWMTIAYQIENIAENWTGAEIGSGSLYRGHTDYSPSNMINISDLTDGYNNTGTYREDQRRTHYVESLDSNGDKNVIWDLSGNIWELVDWEPGGDFTPGPSNCSLNGGAWRSWREIMTDTCSQISPDYYRPRNPQNLSSYTGVSKDLGLIFSVSTSAGYVIRGGLYNDSSSSDSIERYGVFAVNFNSSLAGNSRKGFRCVYRF